jgi:hypothetical protein
MRNRGLHLWLQYFSQWRCGGADGHVPDRRRPHPAPARPQPSAYAVNRAPLRCHPERSEDPDRRAASALARDRKRPAVCEALPTAVW